MTGATILGDGRVALIPAMRGLVALARAGRDASLREPDASQPKARGGMSRLEE